MNVLDGVALRECTSCQMCAALCPKDAISIILNEDGFYRPIIDENSCNSCGLCTKVCYKFDTDIRLTSSDQLSKQALYSAWSNDDTIVMNTTSGGLADVLAHQLLKEGYKVVGCVYNDDRVRAEHRIAHSDEELVFFRGSKYIQSYTLDALEKIVTSCSTNRYAVFGTPCQIYSLSKLASIKKVRNNFFFIDLYCHGCPSLHLWTKYRDDIKNKLGVESIDRISFRSKIRGWGNYCIEVKLKDKTVYKSKANLKGFYELFFSNEVLNGACSDCLLRSSHEYTDIRLGDFWGKKYLSNTRGVSAVSLITERAIELFRRIQIQNVTTLQCDFSEFLSFQSWNKVYQPRYLLRKSILDSLRDCTQTINDACDILYKSQSIKERSIRYARNILFFLPLSTVNFLKRLR